MKHFRLIKTIAEEGNIANASEKLFLTQSALSHQLREMEERLGFKVFIRKRNEWKLTPEGQELYQLSTEVLHSVDEKLKSIKADSRISGGKIRVGCECFSFYLLFPRFMESMSVLYPNIDIKFAFEVTHSPLPKLLSGDIELAIVTSDPRLDALSSKRLLRDELFAIMHREHSFAQKPFIEAADFADIHLIIHSYPLETVSVYEHFLKLNKVIPANITAIPLTEVALEMVVANMGMMCGPKWAYKENKLSDELIFKPISRNGLFRDLYLVYRITDQKKKYINDFVSNFEETIAEEMPDIHLTMDG